MSCSSFATLDEAWGGVGPPTQAHSGASQMSRQEHVSEPAPSDVDYRRTGAPLMDDIVNLYTPADTTRKIVAKMEPARHVASIPRAPGVGEKEKERVKQYEDEKRKEKKQEIRKGDDYSDEDDDREPSNAAAPRIDQDSSTKSLFRRRSLQRRRRAGRAGRVDPYYGDDWDGEGEGEREDDDNSHIIELAAYVLSGVMLIFLFESFITIGGHLRPGATYY